MEIETKFERELSLIMKTIKVDYDGTLLSGKNAFSKLVIDVDLLGKNYIIDWNATPCKITLL